MKQILTPLYLLICVFLLSSCNPNCETYSNFNATIDPADRFPGEQIFVKTEPGNFLLSKELYIKRNDNEVYQWIESEYFAEAGGRRATLDEENVDVDLSNIYVNDDDCGGYIALNSINVIDSAYYNFNPSLFVTPSPSIIIIPPPPIPSPTVVVNTWFSPDDPKYCIWFDPELDNEGNEKTMLKSGYFDSGTLMGTRELRCGGSDSDNDHNNPISGYIDQTTGKVNIRVDRTSKGFDVEEYEGHLVDVNLLPEFYQFGYWCGENDYRKSENVMLLKSKKTGRQLVMYRYVQ